MEGFLNSIRPWRGGNLTVWASAELYPLPLQVLTRESAASSALTPSQPAEKAIDSDWDSFGASSGTSSKWMSVEVPDGSQIGSVLLYNRPDAFYTASCMEIWVSSHAHGDTAISARPCVLPSTACASAPSPSPPPLHRGVLRADCFAGTWGRFVTVVQRSALPLTIAELEVYALPAAPSPPSPPSLPPATWSRFGSSYLVAGAVAAIVLSVLFLVLCFYFCNCMYRHRPATWSLGARMDLAGHERKLDTDIRKHVKVVGVPSVDELMKRVGDGKSLACPKRDLKRDLAGAQTTRRPPRFSWMYAPSGAAVDMPMAHPAASASEILGREEAKLRQIRAVGALSPRAADDGSAPPPPRRPPPPKRTKSAATVGALNAVNTVAAPLKRLPPPPKRSKSVVSGGAAEITSPHLTGPESLTSGLGQQEIKMLQIRSDGVGVPPPKRAPPPKRTNLAGAVDAVNAEAVPPKRAPPPKRAKSEAAHGAAEADAAAAPPPKKPPPPKRAKATDEAVAAPEADRTAEPEAEAPAKTKKPPPPKKPKAVGVLGVEAATESASSAEPASATETTLEAPPLPKKKPPPKRSQVAAEEVLPPSQDSAADQGAGVGF